MKPITSALLGLALLVETFATLATDLEQWPGKDKGLRPPVITYQLGAAHSGPSTCGDFLRAAQDSDQFQSYRTWVMGYITGVNDTRKYGGNVLGAGRPKIDDFLMMVSQYCHDHPMTSLFEGVNAALRKLEPVDWTDVPP